MLGFIHYVLGLIKMGQNVVNIQVFDPAWIPVHTSCIENKKGFFLSKYPENQALEVVYLRDRRLLQKPPLVQDTDNMVETTYHLAPYLGPFGASLCLSDP